MDGSGADTITLQTDVSLTVALPTTASTITIEGGGHTVSGNNDSGVGVIFYNEGDLTLNDTVVSNGNHEWKGGGIYNYNGNVSLSQSTVSGNTASGDGGGIENYKGTVTLAESTVSGNSAETGGGIYNYEGVLNVTSSTVSGNSADTWSGGVYNRADFETAVAILTNSTVSGNSCGSGAAGINNSAFNTDAVATVTLNNSTVTGNSAVSFGGGVYNYSSTGGTAIAVLHNSLISGNTAGGGNEVSNYSYYGADATVTANDYNLFAHSGETNGQAFYGFMPGATDVNASIDGVSAALPTILETTLANNGGNTMTHALLAGSPALDLDPSGTLDEDQRGFSRPVGLGWDAGSFELVVLPPNPCGTGRNLPANTWLMTAPPCAPEPAGIVAQLGDDLPGVYGTNWISFAWNPDIQDYGNPQAADDSLVPGEGNWHYSTSGGTMMLEGNYTAVTTCPTDLAPFLECFAIPLTVNGDGTTRWNLVGNPFPDSVNWADVRVAVAGTFYTPSAAETAGFVSKSYYSWNGNAYETYDDITAGMTGTIPAQHSIWVRTLPVTGIDTIVLWIPKPIGH